MYGEDELNDETNPERTDEDIILNDEVYRTCPICTRVIGGQQSLESHVGTHKSLNAKCEAAVAGPFGPFRSCVVTTQIVMSNKSPWMTKVLFFFWELFGMTSRRNVQYAGGLSFPNSIMIT